jgi:cysteinyl-tRNA synthetase
MIKVNSGETSNEPDTRAPGYLHEWLEQRDAARKAGDYAQADDLRRKIEENGWKVVDTAGGSLLEQNK